MNARFRFENEVGADVYAGAIPIGDALRPGEYVMLRIDCGREDDHTETMVPMRKAEARALASAIMGVAAEL